MPPTKDDRGFVLEPQERHKLTESFVMLHMVALLADDFDPMSEIELLEIEQYLGSALPADYRWFLGNYGASATSQGSLQITSEGKRFEVRSFYGRRVKTVPSLMFVLEDAADLLEDGELPIADDLMGNEITLNARTGNVGFISRLDPCVRGLATSFTDLINKLEPYVYDG